MDMSSHNFPGDKWIVLSTEEIVVKTSLLLPVVLIGLLANVSLLYVVWKYKQLRTPTNMIIANMATVDTLSLSIYPWTFLLVDFFQNYQLGEFGCRVEGWIECKISITKKIVNRLENSRHAHDHERREPNDHQLRPIVRNSHARGNSVDGERCENNYNNVLDRKPRYKLPFGHLPAVQATDLERFPRSVLHGSHESVIDILVELVGDARLGAVDNNADLLHGDINKGIGNGTSSNGLFH